MSSGIEVLILVPLLLPLVAGGAVVAGAAVVAPIAGRTALAGGAILVGGAAGAALLAAQHLNGVYSDSLEEYQQRLGVEHANVQAAFQAHLGETNTANARVRQTDIKAAESAELAFLRSGAQRIQKRFAGLSDVDPRLPQAGIQLLRELERDSPDLSSCHASFQALSEAVTLHAAREREQLRQRANAARFESGESAQLQQSLREEIEALTQNIVNAPATTLEVKTRTELKRLLGQVEHLCLTQPQMAEQGLQMLHRRVGRELSQGAERERLNLLRQEQLSAHLRALSGRISARSQATLGVLEDPQLRASPMARATIVPLDRAIALESKPL